jgi:hypothetical protein
VLFAVRDGLPVSMAQTAVRIRDMRRIFIVTSYEWLVIQIGISPDNGKADTCP